VPPNRHQLQHEPSVICPPAPVRQRPVLAIGEEHPGTPPTACSAPGCTPAAGRASRPKALHQYGRLVRTIYI